MRLAKNMRPEDLGIGRLFEKIQDAVIVADARTQQIVLWNSAAERVFGYSTSEALELRVETLVPEYLKPQHRASMARYTRTGHGPYIGSQELLELPALTKGGEEIHVELSLSSIGPVEETEGGDDERFVLAIVRDITGRKRTKEALLQSEERYRAMVEQALEGIFLVDIDTKRILEANSEYQRLLGYTFEEIVGLTLYDVVAHDRRSIDSYIQRILEAKKHVIGERQHRRKDGSLIDVVVSASRISYGGREAMSVIVHDVTERKLAERMLLESEDRYRRLVEISPETIAVHSEGRIVYINAAGAKLLGASNAEELIGKQVLDFVRSDYVELVKERVRQTQEEGNPTELSEIKMVRLDGGIIDVETKGMPIAYGGVSATQVVIRDITERKQAEAELQASEAELRALFEAMNDIILVLDAQGRCLELAPTNPSLLYELPGDLIGKTLYEVFPLEQAATFLDRIQHALETQRPVNIEYRLQIGEEEVWFDGTISPMMNDSVILVARDLTERKRAEEELRLQERAISASSNGILITGSNQRDNPIVYVNPAFERITGYTAEEAVGRNCRFLQNSDSDQPALEELRSAVREERECTVILRNYRKDGSLFWNELRISPVRDEDGRTTHFVGVQDDVTDRKRAEEEQQEVNRRLSEVANLRADFTAMVAHEIGSPLATIRGFLEMLATGELESAETADALANIRTETDKLSTFVADIRSSAAVEREEFALVPSRTSVGELLEDAARFLKTLPGDHPLIVEVAAKEWVWADLYRVGQVLRNLLSNAVKYSPNGAPIELRAIYGKSPGHVRIEVIDHGSGVHPDDVDRIFEKFGRGRARSGRKAYGVGLGLYLAQRIVRAHGGELRVDPARGGGSMFWFELEVVR